MAAFLENLAEKVLAHPLVSVHLNTRVVRTAGSMGHFTTTLVQGGGPDDPAAGQELTVDHGATVIATGGMEYRPHEYLYGDHPDVLTHLDMDAAFRENDSRILKGRSFAFIQCVGSRNEENPYCSRLCCTHSLKSAICLKKMDPRKRVFVIYRDIRSYGFREDLYREARERGVLFIRYDLERMPELSPAHNGKGGLMLTVFDPVLQMPVTLSPDLVVLASGVVAETTRTL